MIYRMLPEFVEEIPEKVDDGYLYLCLQYNAVIHKCACGCGEIISTPLDRNSGWIMQYDGEAVTLSPSIGNGSYACRSHYFIRGNSMVWLGKIGEIQTKPRRENTFSIKRFLKSLWR